MPELVPKGPTIPVEVMNRLDSGVVVFFCGAGVSVGKGSNLPTFAELVGQVYKENATKPNDVEREALHCEEPDPGRRKPQYDKALGLLERRLGRAAVRGTVIDLLSTKATPPLEAHQALIELSRTGRGLRLVTTNFDRRFVEAGLNEELVDTAPKLPVPKRHDWASLVHLHGRILPDDDGLKLVLTGADFGRAYLTERWAARFVTELFREFTVVFVGYSVSDPVMGYIVDALAAERELGASFTKAFAFADFDGRVADSRARARDAWLAKNIEPILYDKEDGHRLLTETLTEWARIRTDPLHARTRIALNGMKQLPAGRDDPLVERVAWALQDRAAAQALAKEPPVRDEADFARVETWLEMFAHTGLLRFAAGEGNPGAVGEHPGFVRLVDSGYQMRNPRTLDATRQALARWMANHLHVPQVLGWVLRNGGCMHPGLKEEVQARLGTAGSDIPERLRLLWTVLLNHEPTGFWTFLWTSDHYENAASMAERRDIADAVVKAMEPRLTVLKGPSSIKALDRYMDGDRGPIAPIDECGHLKLVGGDTRQGNKVETILEDPEVLARNAERLTDYLELGLELMGKNEDLYTARVFDRPSIAAHDQNRHHHGDGLAHLIDLARDSYTELAATSRARAGNLLRRWVASGETLLRRLALHALAEDPKSDITLARTLLLAGRRPGIWERGLRREVLRFLRMAGKRLPRGLRTEVARAVHAGPKGRQHSAGERDEAMLRQETALRLYKLAVSGAQLDQGSRALAKEAEQAVRGLANERDEFIGWQDGPRWVGVEEFAPEELVQGTAADVAAAVRDERIQPEQFQGVTARQPGKALEALKQLAAQGSWPPGYWQRFLWAIPGSAEEPQDGEELREEAGRVLVAAPDELFEKCGSAAADLVEIQAKVYGKEREEELATLWWRAWGGVVRGERARPEEAEDPLNDALGDPAGRLAEAAYARMRKYGPQVGDGLPPQVRPYFDAIADEPNGHLARVILARRLYRLHAIDPAWTGTALIERMGPGRSEEAANLWYAYGASLTIGPDLLEALKDAFLEVLTGGEVDARTEYRLTGLFMAVCLEAPNELTEPEKRRVVGAMSEEGLKTVLGSLQNRLTGEPEERGRIWREILSPWLEKYWPPGEERNNAGTSEAMIALLAQCGDAFPEATASSLKYLQPVQDGLFPLRECGHAREHREQMLELLKKVIAREALAAHERRVLREILVQMAEADDSVQADPRFQCLLQIADL